MYACTFELLSLSLRMSQLSVLLNVKRLNELIYATTDEADGIGCVYVLQVFFLFSAFCFFRSPQKYQTTVLWNG